MKSLTRLMVLACLVLIWGSGCSSTKKSKRETFIPLSKSVVDLVSQATFEVVVAKETNTSLIFDQDPMEDAPFQKKGDSYVNIGTAFLAGPNRFVSAAHVLQVDYPSLLAVLKLRDMNGKIYTPTQVTRYSNFRDLIEFQVEQPDQSKNPLVMTKDFSAGDTVFAVGNFDGDGISYRSAQTLQSIPESTEGKWKYIRFYSPAAEGAIGGPLVNDKGQVVGILLRRNPKEKMSFGIPSPELETLPTDHAEFNVKKLPFRVLPKNLEKDWVFSPSLPKNIEQLIAEARASLSDLVKTTYENVNADKTDQYFPKHKGFRSYLRTQEVGPDLGYLVSDPYGSHWKVSEVKPDHEKELSGSKQAKDYAARGFIPVLVELPEGSSIGDFNSNPTKVATTMISSNSLGAFSKTGNNSYLMSVGKPDHQTSWIDQLGRTWTSAQWYYHDANYALSTTCTPVPVGNACIVRMGTYSAIALEDEYIPQFMNQIMVSYHGSLAQWKNFLAEIDPKSLPQTLKDAHVDFVKEKNVDVHIGNFSFNYSSPKIDADSKLYAKAGYDPNQDLAPTILSVGLYPAGDENEWLAVETRYEPLGASAEGKVSSWDRLSRKHSPYDGTPETRKNNDAKRIMKVLDMSPKTADQAQSAMVAICQTPIKRSEEELGRTCDEFIKSLKIRSQ